MTTFAKIENNFSGKSKTFRTSDVSLEELAEIVGGAVNSYNDVVRADCGRDGYIDLVPSREEYSGVEVAAAKLYAHTTARHGSHHASLRKKLEDAFILVA